MKHLPPNSSAFVWTPTGPKIVRTDSCGEMVDLSSLRPSPARARKPLPEALVSLLASEPPAPESGAGVPL